MKVLASIMLVIALVFAVSGCGSSSGDKKDSTTGGEKTSSVSGGNKTDSTKKKVFTVALSENPNNIDPHDQDNLPVDSMLKSVFDTLVVSDQKGNYSPSLAESWESSEDGLTWTFKLRKGVKFHNGEDFTSASVVATMQRLIDHPELVCANTYWPTLKEVKAVDDYTAQIILSDKVGAFLLAVSSTPIIPAKAWEEMGTKLFTEQKMYGTGPWKFVEWVDGEYIHLEKNEDFWGDFDSYYDEVYMRHILETSTAISAHLAGEVQAYIASDGIPSNMLSRYEGTEDKIDIIKYTSGNYYYMGFQCKEGHPFSDVNTRKAFDHAINRQLIIDQILGAGSVPNGVIPSTAFGYNTDLEPYEYNPEKAKEYLAKSSYKGEPIVLSSNTGTLKSQDILVVISEMLNEVGFNTSVQVVEAATLRDMRATGEYDVFMVTLWYSGGDPYSYLNYRVLNDGHHSNYKNQELLDLVVKSNAEVDQDKRSQYIQEISKFMREEAGPHISLVQVELTQAIDKGVTGVNLYDNGFFDFRYVSYNE